MSGSPANNGLLPAAKNYYFYPLSWRSVGGITESTEGTTVFKLNNGTFVAISSEYSSGGVWTATPPQFTEIDTGVVAMNTFDAWGAIIDLNSGTMYYNYSSYVPSFIMERNDTLAADLIFLKIFNKYSSSLDAGQLGALYTTVQNASTTPVAGWTVWNGATGTNLGDYYADFVTSAFAPHDGIYVFDANVPPGGDAVFSGGGIQMLNATAIQTHGKFGYYVYPQGGGSNLLPWRYSNVFLLHGTYYAFDSEYIYRINLTNGSSGVVQGAPVAVAYAIGLQYLCVSPNKAYFLSAFDNSVYYFDGGNATAKMFQANRKSQINYGIYSTRDDALYLITIDSIITLREEASTGINAEGLQITENDLPTGWGASSFAKSTANGLYFIVDNDIVARSYDAYGTIIPMDYQTAYMAPAEWMTMQVQRIVGQVLWTQNVTGTLTLSFNYIRVDGTTGVDTATVTNTTRNAQGHSRFSWTPPTSNVLAGSVRVQHDGSEQKIVMMELVMYQVPGPEVIPLTEIAV
jgi:hypothetical protein